MKKKVVIIGGGTSKFINSHLAISSIAYGTTAQVLEVLLEEIWPEVDVITYYTKMVDNSSKLETPQDISNLVDTLIKDMSVKAIFFTVSMIDYEVPYDNGKFIDRVHSSNEIMSLTLTKTDKVINKIRKNRKDIFLVGFKQSTGLDIDQQYSYAMNLCKSASCNLVFANDTLTKKCFIVTPEESRYGEGCTKKTEVLDLLVSMVKLRSNLTFTQSTVISGDLVKWFDKRIPNSLRTIIEYLISEGAYKPFRGVTTGHFAFKIDDENFITSIRRTNFNNIVNTGMVHVKTDGPDTVIAYGAKPSVGGQSQRIIFREHVGYDCIVHFHCPLLRKTKDDIPLTSQFEFECGSHECGQNTSNNLKQYGNLRCVYLDNHGPNIIFNRDIDPEEVISFIKSNFDLTAKTGGYLADVHTTVV